MSDRKLRELLELPEPFYVTHARKVLEDYYEEPVYPVSQVCSAIDTWIARIHVLADEARRVGESNHHGVLWDDYLDVIRLNIRKSSLLSRLLYSREKFRTRPCPVHHAAPSAVVEFFGEDACPHGCQLTGWLPEP